MKLGIIFKKEFQELYGQKKEFVGDVITIKNESHYDTSSHWGNYIYIRWRFTDCGTQQECFPAKAIQLIYLGGWKD